MISFRSGCHRWSHLQDAGRLLATILKLQTVLLHPVRRHRLQPDVCPCCSRALQHVSAYKKSHVPDRPI